MICLSVLWIKGCIEGDTNPNINVIIGLVIFSSLICINLFVDNGHPGIIIYPTMLVLDEIEFFFFR